MGSSVILEQSITRAAQVIPKKISIKVKNIQKNAQSATDSYSVITDTWINNLTHKPKDVQRLLHYLSDLQPIINIALLLGNFTTKHTLLYNRL